MVSNHGIHSRRNSFFFKYLLSSTAAVVAETGLYSFLLIYASHFMILLCIYKTKSECSLACLQLHYLPNVFVRVFFLSLKAWRYGFFALFFFFFLSLGTFFSFLITGLIILTKEIDDFNLESRQKIEKKNTFSKV